MRKSNRGNNKRAVTIVPFEDAVPEVFDVLATFLEEKGVKSSGLFTVKVPKSEIDELMARIEKGGRTCVLGKESSVYAAANLLDVMINTLGDSVVPVEFHDVINMSLLQVYNLPSVQQQQHPPSSPTSISIASSSSPSDRDRIRCLRRCMQCLPPGNRAMMYRMSTLLQALRSKQRHNKVDQAVIDSVFAYALCHAQSDASVGPTSSSFAEFMSRQGSAVLRKATAIEEYDPEKDAELAAPFVSALRSACERYANRLLPVPASMQGAAASASSQTPSARLTVRSSRKSVQGWDETFALVKPLTSKGETNKIKLSPHAKDLGKLFFEGKFNAAKKFLERRQKDADAVDAAEAAMPVVMKDVGVYTGPKDAATGKPHGQGKLVFANGDVYEGSFVQGEMTGNGKLTMEDGSCFTGSFVNGKIHGNGSFVYANGDKYVGDFAEDSFHGQGKYVSASGTCYEGAFERGLRHGKGSFKTPNFRFVGEYEHDQMCGLGIYTFSNGDEYMGEFKESQFHGKGVFKSKAGRQVEGIFEKGRYIGPDPDAR